MQRPRRSLRPGVAQPSLQNCQPCPSAPYPRAEVLASFGARLGPSRAVWCVVEQLAVLRRVAKSYGWQARSRMVTVRSGPTAARSAPAGDGRVQRVGGLSPGATKGLVNEGSSSWFCLSNQTHDRETDSVLAGPIVSFSEKVLSQSVDFECPPPLFF